MEGCHTAMNTHQFVRLLRAQAELQGVLFHIETNRGKGSHRMAHFGRKKAIVPWVRGDIPFGTMRAILAALGIPKDVLK